MGNTITYPVRLWRLVYQPIAWLGREAHLVLSDLASALLAEAILNDYITSLTLVKWFGMDVDKAREYAVLLRESVEPEVRRLEESPAGSGGAMSRLRPLEWRPGAHRRLAQ